MLLHRVLVVCSERLEKNFWPKDMETQPRASTRESKNNNKIRPNPPSTPRARERERERESNAIT